MSDTQLRNAASPDVREAALRSALCKIKEYNDPPCCKACSGIIEIARNALRTHNTENISELIDQRNELLSALMVMVKDGAISDWLSLNDKQALRQAINAIAKAGGGS